MDKSREDAPFLRKTFARGGGIHSDANQLDRGALANVLDVAFAQVDRAHAATAKYGQYLPVAEAIAGFLG